MNRKELQETYIQRMIDYMDINDALELLHDFMNSDIDKLTDEQLIEEVKHYHPDLLEGWIQTPELSP